MNKVILIGRLVRDPEIRCSHVGEQEIPIAKYTVAVNRRTRHGSDSQTADFINCVAFARYAEFAEKYMRKGTKIAITGRINTRSYTNRDGQKVYTTDIIVEEQEFAESKRTGEAAQQNPVPVAREDSFMEIPDGLEEELPFN